MFYRLDVGVVNFLRIICSVITIVALITGYAWIYQQEVVNSIDESLSTSYFGQYKLQLIEVNELFEAQNYEAAAIQAEYFLGAMELIRNRDKNYAIKRQLLLRLIQSKVHLGTTHAMEVVPYAELWFRSDKRDITALRAYILVLKSIPGDEEDLQEAVKLFHLRFPGKSVSHPDMK